MNPTDKKQTNAEAIIGAKLMKKLADEGYVIVKKVDDEKDDSSHEADVSSGQPQAILAAKPKKESSAFTNDIRSQLRLIEKDSSESKDSEGRKFKVILIQEGLGNLKDLFYYTRECLQNSVSIFEGKKIFANHPDKEEEQLRPERDVKDILGHFENVEFDESEGRGKLIAEVNILPDQAFDWARALLKQAVEYSKKYPDKEFVGLSINASGDAEDMGIEDFMNKVEIPDEALKKLASAKDQGAEKIRVVSNISDAISVDLVTEAGAGGKILEMIEGAKKMAKQAVKESEKELPVKKDDKEQPAPDMAKAEAEADGKIAGDDAEQHSDKDQDIELIKKMIKKHMGKGDEDELDEAECKQAEAMEAEAKEVYEMAKEAGMEAEAAMKCAEVHMKHKQKQAMESEAKKESKEGSEAMEGHKESAAILKLKGENQKLKESLRKVELDKHLDSKLAETGLARSATKKIRESVAAAKSEKDIDAAIELFMEGYKSAESGEVIGEFISVEKQGNVTTGLDFSDCE